MEVNQAVVDEYKQNEITQEEAKKEKKRKKDIKAGKNVEESEDNKSQAGDQKQKEEEKVRYVMGDHYDQTLSDIRKVDYQFEELMNKAKVKALKNNEMQVYDDLENKKMNRA